MKWESRFFTLAEFACKDGSQYPMDWNDRFTSLTSQLDVIREHLGYPVVVISGYRTSKYNSKVGGARNSLHVQGRAADIRPAGYRNGERVAWEELDTGERIRIIADFGALIDRLIAEGKLPYVGGVGVYPGRWAHLDVRAKPPDGRIARWTGTGIGSEASG